MDKNAYNFSETGALFKSQQQLVLVSGAKQGVSGVASRNLVRIDGEIIG
jgi:hypothetical protein